MKNIKSNKQKTQQVLATLVMGMNLVNTVTPVVAAMQNVPEQIDVLPVPMQTEAQPLEYTFLPHTLNFVDSVIFSKAEAKEYQAEKVDKMEPGDKMKILAGQVGEVEINNSGMQTISSGGLGKIGTQFQGTQTIETGGSGYIKRCSGGRQVVSAFGTGSMFDMEGKNGAATQVIYKNGVGNIQFLISGRQEISGGVGNITTLKNGVQSINNGGTGNIDILNGNPFKGSQLVVSGTGNINRIDAGYQQIYRGGIGNINALAFGGKQRVYGGTGNIVINLGGWQHICVPDAIGNTTTMVDGRQIILSGGTGTIAEFKGGTQELISGGTSLNTTMVWKRAAILLYDDTAKVSNAYVHDGTILFGSKGGGDYGFSGDFTFDGGTVEMTKDIKGDHRDSYETLSVENLKKGGGTFVMNTDLESEKDSDKITIKNADAGTSYVKVVDKSLQGTKPVSANKKLLLITVENGKADFVGKEINTGGLWSVLPTIKNGKEIGESDKDWYLTNITKEINKDTEVLLKSGDNAYALWRNTNDTMRKRLGDLRLRNNIADGDGIWARYTGGKFGTGSFDASYHMYQFGYDKADNDKSTYGFALEKGSGNGSYGSGNSKNKLFAGSFYGVWTGEDGSYTDVVAKIGQFSNEVKSYGEYPDKAKYKNHMCSLSAEYGKTIKVNEKAGTFVEPQAQFIVGRLGSADYTTDRGNKVHFSGVNSYIGRLGFVLGQKDESENEVYFKASVLREFGGNRNVQMQAANGDNLDMSKDYGDTWFELGLGTNIKLSKASYFYGDIERSFGADIKKRWQINAGLRFSF